jgi:lysophospholipase L1-like esterase
MRPRLHALIAFFFFALPAFASERMDQQTDGHWVGTWAAAPMACAVKSGEPSAGDSTYRNIVRSSVGGHAVRVKLSNEFGASQLVVGAARIALAAGDGAIASGSDHALTFGGRASVTIPAGGYMLSDQVAMDVPSMASLAVSVYVIDQEIATRTCHLLACSTNYVAKGDATQAVKMEHARATGSWYFVKGIDVLAGKNAFAVVALGDSITDGAASTKDANHRWPDVLVERFQQRPSAPPAAVLNEGIIGNRLLRSSEFGPSAIARFDRDVLAQTGARYLILLEGINDISWGDPDENAPAEEIIVALAQLVERAHLEGVKVFAATILPSGGADGFSDKGESVRAAVNQWIRTGGAVDGVIDFDKATRDSAKPANLNPAYDSGDHLHPNDAGYEAMARAIDLTLFP